ncbi:MAG: cation transporter [Myxococcales bacterium]|nr:cation transporter [Myxococcales bacterium]
MVVGLTATILVAEVVGGLLSGSRALLADAGHMLSDLAAQIVSLAALAIAARPADVRRTYGYHRVEILAALGNGVALLALAAWLLFSATQRLRHGGGEIHTGLMIAVAAVGLVANLIGAWVLSGARSLNVRAAYLHLLLDTLSSLAVVIGGTVMALVSGLYVLDSILALAIGLFVILGAWRLCRDAVDVLLEAVPAGMESDGVARAMGRCGGVREVHDLHIWTITSGLLALSAHVVVDSGDVHRNDDLLKELKELLLRDYRIAHTTIQIESHEYEHVGDTCGAEGAR